MHHRAVGELQPLWILPVVRALTDRVGQVRQVRRVRQVREVREVREVYEVRCDAEVHPLGARVRR